MIVSYACLVIPMPPLCDRQSVVKSQLWPSLPIGKSHRRTMDPPHISFMTLYSNLFNIFVRIRILLIALSTYPGPITQIINEPLFKSLESFVVLIFYPKYAFESQFRTCHNLAVVACVEMWPAIIIIVTLKRPVFSEAVYDDLINYLRNTLQDACY